MHTARTTLRALAAAVGLVASETALAQSDTVTAREAQWASAPETGTDTSYIYFQRPGARQLGIMYIETTSRTPAGYLVVQQNVRTNGAVVSLDSVAFDATTFAPQWHADKTPLGSMRVTFADGRVRGASIDTLGKSTTIDAEVPAGAVDFSVSNSLMQLLPLRAGYSVVIRSYDIHRGPIHTPVQVIGEEDLEVDGRIARAWKVETRTGDRPVTSWIEQATRRLLRVRVDMGTYEMIMEGEKRP